MRTTEKFILAFGIVVLSATLVSATTVILNIFGTVNTTLSVSQQSITIDGHTYDSPVTETIDNVIAGSTVYGPEHVIKNWGDHTISLMWAYEPFPEGLTSVSCVDPLLHTPIDMSVPSGETHFVFAYVIGDSVGEGTVLSSTATLKLAT